MLSSEVYATCTVYVIHVYNEVFGLCLSCVNLIFTVCVCILLNLVFQYYCIPQLLFVDYRQGYHNDLAILIAKCSLLYHNSNSLCHSLKLPFSSSHS